ncbi:hypothetical protein ACWCQN_25200 [Streptomyces sp. NPDC001984]
MSDSADRPDWKRMTRTEFGHPARKPNQDALFLVDEPGACGTDALEGLGFGAVLWADQGDIPPASTDPHTP